MILLTKAALVTFKRPRRKIVSLSWGCITKFVGLCERDGAIYLQNLIESFFNHNIKLATDS